MKNKSRVIPLALFLAVFMMIITFGGQKVEWKSKSNLLKIKFVEDLIIESSGEGYSFFAQGVEADSEGNIYIMDRYDFRVLKFDKEGMFTGAIGKKGQGPGEFETPTFMIIDKRDNLYVQDVARGLLVIFNKKGEFVENIKRTGMLYYLSKVMIDPDLNIICGYQPLSTIDDEQIYKISKFNRDFNHLSDIYEKKGVFITKRIRTGRGTFSTQAPRYTPEVIWTMDSDGRFYVSYNDSYSIKILSNNGELINEINRKHKPDKISDEEQKEMLESYEKRFKGISNYIDFPKVKPPILRLYTVEDYVFALRKRIGNEYFFDVFDKQGNYVDEITLDFLPWVNKNNFVYTLRFIGNIETRDITDIEVYRYKIVSNID